MTWSGSRGLWTRAGAPAGERSWRVRGPFVPKDVPARRRTRDSCDSTTALSIVKAREGSEEPVGEMLTMMVWVSWRGVEVSRRRRDLTSSWVSSLKLLRNPHRSRLTSIAVRALRAFRSIRSFSVRRVRKAGRGRERRTRR